MKRKKVWRYYCDHCGKSGCSGGHMKRHEASCTNNPERVCNMCRKAGIEQAPMWELIHALGDGSDLEKIRDLSENCPVCILSAIRQSKLQHFSCEDEGISSFRVDFDFEKELRSFWSDYNGANDIF